MFGVVPKVLWQKLATPDESNRIDLNCNCLLLRNATDTVLIETGYGGKWTEKDRTIFAMQQRTIVDALCEIDIAPTDITHVIVSHLHFDHAGGLTHLNDAGDPVSSFPNARIFSQQREWDDALANRSTMTRTYLRNHLDPVASQMQLVDGETEVLPNITVWPVPGHTWGQQAIRFEDGNGMVAFIGDVMPTVQHIGLAFSLAYDMEPFTNMLTKRDLLSRASSENWRIALDHEPGDPIVTVAPDPQKHGRYVLNAVPTPTTAD